jgi:hypothetical protein
VFNKNVKVPLQEAELVGTSSSNNAQSMLYPTFRSVLIVGCP